MGRVWVLTQDWLLQGLFGLVHPPTCHYDQRKKSSGLGHTQTWSQEWSECHLNPVVKDGSVENRGVIAPKTEETDGHWADRCIKHVIMAARSPKHLLSSFIYSTKPSHQFCANTQVLLPAK